MVVVTIFKDDDRKHILTITPVPSVITFFYLNYLHLHIIKTPQRCSVFLNGVTSRLYCIARFLVSHSISTLKHD